MAEETGLRLGETEGGSSEELADDTSSKIKKGARKKRRRNLMAEGRHVQQLKRSLLVLKHLETGG